MSCLDACHAGDRTCLVEARVQRTRVYKVHKACRMLSFISCSIEFRLELEQYGCSAKVPNCVGSSHRP